MSGSMNKVILIGYLGKDPECRSTQDGRRIASFSVATSETWKDKISGERKEKIEWHNVAVYNERLAEISEKCLKKGTRVAVEGALQTRKWTDKSGSDRYTTEVALQNFRGEITILSDGRAAGITGSAASREERSPRREPARAPIGRDIDDDIPF